jgi:hypothetical protein
MKKENISYEIREIWQEMKELRNMREGKIISDIGNQTDFEKRMLSLEKKFEEIEILFGNEATLSKAIIYYLSN